MYLSEKGISAEVVAEQLKRFETGFPFLKLEGAATTERGVLAPSQQEIDEYLDIWDNYCAAGNEILKFVPASGAASRMFKDLFSFLDADYNVPTNDFEKKFFENIEKFAFYGDLNDMCVKNNGLTIKELIEKGEYKSVVANLLDSTGLNYGSLPKGLLKFHTYKEAATSETRVFTSEICTKYGFKLIFSAGIRALNEVKFLIKIISAPEWV